MNNFVFWSVLLSRSISGLAPVMFMIKEQDRQSIEWKRRMKFSFRKHIPNLAYEYVILSDGTRAKSGTITETKLKSGTIIKRPLKKPLGSVGYHYAIILGTDINGMACIIEMTDDSDIRIVTWEQFFTSDYSFEDLEYDLPNEPITSGIILERALSYEFQVYNVFDFNCIDFADWCVYEIPPVKRSRHVVKAALTSNEVGLNLSKSLLPLAGDERTRDFFRESITQMQYDRFFLAYLS